MKEETIRELEENMARLMENKEAVVRAMDETVGFVPNWKKHGLKSQKVAVSYVLAYLKKYEKIISDTGFGETKILNGEGNVLLELKGSKMKRKKELMI